MKAGLVVACIALVSGCLPAASPLRAKRDPFAELDKDKPKDRLVVSLAVIVPGPPERHLRGDEPLHNGDKLAFKVWTNQDAYVNMVLVSPDGKPDVLFPDNGVNQLKGRCPIRIPRIGWLQLDGPMGPENLRLVASVRTLAKTDPDLCRAMRLPCSSLSEPAHPAECSSAPAVPTANIRDIAPLLPWAADNGSGAADLRVTLQHLP